jgi:hypothetical protein
VVDSEALAVLTTALRILKSQTVPLHSIVPLVVGSEALTTALRILKSQVVPLHFIAP